MYQTREIIYDYKIRIAWGKEEKRFRRLRLALAMAAPISVALLGGMASDELRNHHFRLPPWGALVEKQAPSPERLLHIQAPSESAPRGDTSFLEPEPGEIFTRTGAERDAVMRTTVALPLTDYPLEPASHLRTFLEAKQETDQVTGGWQTITVKTGDNLSLIFDRLHLSGADLDRILGLGGDTARLKRLNPEDSLRIRIEGGAFAELVHDFDLGHTLHVRNNDGAFTAETVVADLETRVVHASGVIQSSLFEAGQTAGLSDTAIMNMADIFDFDIDLVLDIREGDRFSVVYEEIYQGGKKVKEGTILAAEFVNQGKSIRAVRYEDRAGHADYYRADGQTLRKAFIRTPVEFTRITSRFSTKRRHPILNRIRAHKGVDYAAPTGTPVRATGDAKVAYVGWQGGYGHVVMLDHAGGYTTVYGHLSRFAKSVKQGASVRQGQTIGYVGQSGLATGSHLHYEFRVNGVHRDPLKVALPKSLPIGKNKRADFKEKTKKALALLHEASNLAAAQSRERPAITADAQTDAESASASKRTVVATAPR